MSINDELPREVENAIRQLLDDDLFVDHVWSHGLVFYHDARSMDIHAISKGKAVGKAKRTLNAVKNLQQAMKLADYYCPPGRWSQTLDEMEKYYGEHLERFENLPQKQNRALLGMANNLLRVFQNYGANPKKLTQFMQFAVPLIEPLNHHKEKEIDPPSDSAIEKAVSTAKKTSK